MYLRGKYPYKHNNEIKDILNTKLNGWVQEEECTDIIKYMYNKDDADLILRKIKPLYRNMHSK